MTSSPWPIGRLPIEEPEYSSSGSASPLSSPGRSTPVRRAEAVFVHPLVEAFGALQRADLDRADVARLREDFGGRQGLFGVFLGVVDHAVGDLDLVGDRKGRIGSDQAAFQRARDRDDLEGRARFVVEADRAVFERADSDGTSCALGFSCGQFAIARTAPVRGFITIAVASGRVEDAPDRAQHRFGALLDVRVQRQRDPRPRLLAVDVRDRDRLAERVADDPPLARHAAQERVLGVLEARARVAFGVDQAQHLARERAARVDAAHRRRRRHAGDVQGRTACACAAGSVAREVHEAAVLAQVRQDLRARAPQQRRQARPPRSAGP